jgi:hypothetical protein
MNGQKDLEAGQFETNGTSGKLGYINTSQQNTKVSGVHNDAKNILKYKLPAANEMEIFLEKGNKKHFGVEDVCNDLADLYDDLSQVYEYSNKKLADSYKDKSTRLNKLIEELHQEKRHE